MKMLAGALLVIAGAGVVILKSMSNQNWGGLWWLAAGLVVAVCLLAASWLVRHAEQRSSRESGT